MFKTIRSALVALALIAPTAALASQGSCNMPTVGTVSGLTLVQDMNLCFDASQTANSGATAPANITSGPKLGQLWLDTASGNALKIYDGANWLVIGEVDASNHVWTPPMGGGTATVASATTTDLCSVPQTTLTISGVTTITSFSNTCVAGTLKPLIFSGIMTLTHSSSLLLPNAGNNITTAAGDRAWAAYLGGGNWEVITYQRADGTTLSTAATIGAAQLLASAQGMNAPINLRINATVGSSALTVAIKTAANADATALSPIQIPFRDPTVANGNPVISSQQAALSFTVASTNTMGAPSGNVAFRLWVIAYYNGGTLAAGLFNASTATRIFGLSEDGLVSTAASTNGGSSAGTYYANVSTITGTPYRILGYLEWGSGLATAGTWASAPTKIVLFGPGIKKPGDVVQTVYATTTTPTTVSSTANTATNLAGTITPTSAVNLVKVLAFGTINSTSSSQHVLVQIYRGTGSTAIGNICAVAAAGNGVAFGGTGTANYVLDNPASASSVQYGVYIKDATSTPSWIFLGTNSSIPTNTGVMTMEEIMGALDEPANDNVNPGTYSLTG
jgi:hypothetical protein